MRAMVLARAGARLAQQERPDPEPGPGEVRLRVLACGVCRTDLHVVDGDQPPPCPLDAAIIFAPAGELVPLALRAVRKGGRVVCGGIYMTPIPAMDYALLWEERELVSVANLTRDDAREFLAAAAATPLFVEARAYALSRANEALDDLRSGRIVGAAVLVP